MQVAVNRAKNSCTSAEIVMSSMSLTVEEYLVVAATLASSPCIVLLDHQRVFAENKSQLVNKFANSSPAMLVWAISFTGINIMTSTVDPLK